MGGSSDPLDPAVTKYSALQAPQNVQSSSRQGQIVSASGKIGSLKVQLSAAPGVGKHYKFTIMVATVASGVEVIIADDATYGEDMLNEVLVAPGDILSIRCDPDAAPDAVNGTWTTVFEGDNVNESLIMGATGFSILNAGAIEYYQVMCGWHGGDAVENNSREVCPTAGTIKDFYVRLSGTPGVDPDGYRFTVRLNGATVAQSLIVEIIDPDITGSDLIHNLVVAAGNVLTMMCEPLNTPSTAIYARWGMTFVADIDGESIALGGASNWLPINVTEYNYVLADAESWIATEADRVLLGQTCTVKKLHMLLADPPSAGDDYDFTIRIGGADSNVTIQISDLETTGNSGALEDDVGPHEYVSLKVVPTSLPDAVSAFWGFVIIYKELLGGIGAKSPILELLLAGVLD